MTVASAECAVPLDKIKALAPVSLGNVKALSPVSLSDLRAMGPIEFNCTLGQAGLWTGEGPPGTIVGAAVGDEYLDLLTGTIYTLNPG